MTIWPRVPLGEVVTVQGGSTPSSNNSAFWGGPIPWITPAEMGNRTSPFVATTRRTLSAQGLASCSAKLLPAGSVILSSRAPIGHVVINEVPMATNQGCKGLVPSNKILAEFLRYTLLNSVRQLNELGAGTTFKEVTSAKVKNFEILLPPIAEQKRIVAKLDEASGALIKLTENVEKGEKLEKALWACVLNQATEPSVTTWPVVPFTRHVHVYQPETIALKHLDPSGQFPVFGANGKIGCHSRYNHENVELLLGCRGSVGSINWSEPRSWINGNAMVVRPEPELLKRDFVAHFLSRSEGLRVAISGTAQPQITRTSLQSLLIPLPPLDEQERIVAKLDELKTKLSELRRLRAARTTALEAFQKSLSSTSFSQAA